MNAAPYPLRVTATLDTHLNRWLWLVKWVLAIPHCVVLAVLWFCFVVLSVVAFFAILFTGRYPRGIFDFNVGVLRWSWRVGYYTYGALGTDQYPPFTLEEVPDYPAHLEISYPEHLSRGLVLVKWWLLAIPQYLIVGLFGGGGLWAVSETSDQGNWGWNGAGLISLLVLIAGVVLLFSGNYPRGLFDLILGLNRWVLRVAAYAGLMTDRYPPFRLDMGGDEPGGSLVMDRPPQPPGGSSGATGAPGSPPPPAPPAPPGPSSPSGTGRWTAGRVVTLVIGVIVALAAGTLLAAGATVGLVGHSVRDGQGFYMSPTETFTSDGRAVVSETIRLPGTSNGTWSPASILGDLKLRVQSNQAGPVFVGVARSADVTRYLTGVPHSVVTDVGGTSPNYDQFLGTRTPAPPGKAGFWVAQTQGSGSQELTWPASSGSWRLVVMNTDASAPVAADASIGTTFPAMGRFVTVALVTGGLLLVLGVVLIVIAVRSPRPAPAAYPGPYPPDQYPPTQYAPASGPPASGPPAQYPPTQYAPAPGPPASGPPAATQETPPGQPAAPPSGSPDPSSEGESHEGTRGV